VCVRTKVQEREKYCHPGLKSGVSGVTLIYLLEDCSPVQSGKSLSRFGGRSKRSGDSASAEEGG
jgi:hypothetical protein